MRLPSPLPVHLLYQTVWVDDAGSVQFRRDVYQRDARILAALPAATELLADQNEVKNPADRIPVSLLHH